MMTTEYHCGQLECSIEQRALSVSGEEQQAVASLNEGSANTDRRSLSVSDVLLLLAVPIFA